MIHALRLDLDTALVQMCINRQVAEGREKGVANQTVKWLNYILL